MAQPSRGWHDEPTRLYHSSTLWLTHGSCSYELDTSETRKKQFYDRVDFDLLLTGMAGLNVSSTTMTSQGNAVNEN